MLQRYSQFGKTLSNRFQPMRSIGGDGNAYAFEASKNDPGLAAKRHSAAHILAMAVQNIVPDAQATIGPCIENGFYYDFHFPSVQVTEEKFPMIKLEMKRIIKSKLMIEKEVVSAEKAREMIMLKNEPYKLEILDDILSKSCDSEISLYHMKKEGISEWWDLCAGPHVEHTGKIDIKALELQSVAGAYWKGDEKKQMLTRIYGTLWNNKTELQSFKQFLEDGKKRDHRLLGQKLNLFAIHADSAGGGLVFWYPKGSIVRRAIEDYWKDEHARAGYELVYTPHLANLELWKTSGHAEFYKDDMFNPISVQDKNEQLYQLRPMNCPFHCLTYKGTGLIRSYKEFPIRYAELGTVYRYERSGALHGLFRVRGFTQDDAHIFCLPSQITTEIENVLNLTFRVLEKFQFTSFEIKLSTRPVGEGNSIGSDDLWNVATSSLENALTGLNLEYEIDEGAGAFYGPKIDVKVKDALGRYWQCSTIQCDFNLPERFNLQYKDSSQTLKQPIMIHRAIFGSLERFMGILIENTEGNFPLWLAPTQCRIMSITDDVAPYCEELKHLLENHAIRCEFLSPSRTVNGSPRIAKQIKNAEEEKIPFQIVIGKNEMENRTVSIRYHKLGVITHKMCVEDMCSLIKYTVDQSATHLNEPSDANKGNFWSQYGEHITFHETAATEE